MFVYKLPPIDCWTGWRKPSKVFRVQLDVSAPASAEREAWEAWRSDKSWNKLWAAARSGARRLGWDGDVREGPLVCVLPWHDSESPNLAPVVIGWKQDDDGTTFVASPVRLPWLGAEAQCTVWVGETENHRENRRVFVGRGPARPLPRPSASLARTSGDAGRGT